ncbi:carboxypeptidase-like regulatory domain-containing protein [Yeosuana marina]|uniref:carboxypeptidase-like regulatory domain-containing protein n=1 Tax=Yeosuana marina TaxID=1565536 RepID=UPI0030EE4451|tara:strand:+ start:309 stop:1112 length:804 start_codon:yes stop_codon:yes gene_type:complete
MKRIVLFITIILCITSVRSQTITRINVKGIIHADFNDVENVTIYNTSSNKGTITNDKGEFTIKVALNDIIEISALQFKTVSVTITKEVIDSKLLKISLVESVNQLDAVVLSSGLSGNIALDIDDVRMPAHIELDLGNMDMAFEYNDDKAFDRGVLENQLNAIVNKGQLHNGVNFVAISKLIFKSKKNKTVKNQIPQEPKPKELLDVYSSQDISKTFNIPLNDVQSFIGFLESKEFNQDLLKKENEVQLIEFLIAQRRLFLKLEDGKN